MKHFVYILSNKKKGVLYIGETKNLKKRIYQHKNKVHRNAFTARYNLDKLIYFEEWKTKEDAVLREKQMKKWNRDWKINLIESINPDWIDLYDNFDN